jgi:hypothetical protein
MKIISFIRDPRVIFRILDHLDMLKEPEGEPTRGPPEESAITGACPAPRWRKLIEDNLRWELKRPSALGARWELKRPSALGAPGAMILFTSVEGIQI